MTIEAIREVLKCQDEAVRVSRDGLLAAKLLTVRSFWQNLERRAREDGDWHGAEAAGLILKIHQNDYEAAVQAKRSAIRQMKSLGVPRKGINAIIREGRREFRQKIIDLPIENLSVTKLISL